MATMETQTTASDAVAGTREPWKNIIIVSILAAIVLFTVTSNMTVLIAFYLEKKLHNSFTYLVANLAVTDFLVGAIPMSFYSLNFVLGYWPLGKIICGLWIYFDFCMVLASILTLLAISVDR